MRLIDVDRAELYDAIGRNAFRDRQDIIDLINNQPTVDAEVVVRCKNCTSGIMSDDNKYIICCRLGVGMEFNDFCSYGERKNEGDGYATD